MLQEWASSKNKDAPQRYSIMLNKLLTWLCYQRIDFAPSPFTGWSLLTDDENGRGQPVTCLNCIDWIVPIGDVGARSSSTAACAVSLAEQILHQSLYSCIPSNSHIRVFSRNFIRNVSWTLCGTCKLWAHGLSLGYWSESSVLTLDCFLPAAFSW